MSDWERCLAQEAAEFAEAEAQEADTLAAMQTQWESLQPHELVADEWDENEYDYH